jgi:hypothetical protein
MKVETTRTVQIVAPARSYIPELMGRSFHHHLSEIDFRHGEGGENGEKLLPSFDITKIVKNYRHFWHLESS